MHISRTLSLLALVPCAAVACGSPSGRRDAPVSRDSAGVRIVENDRATWSVPWHVDARPLLSVGSVEGDSGQLLDRVAGAVALAGGGIVVANAGSLQLLFYDEDGILRRRVGGQGRGPGEFASLEWLSRYGPDSVLALDVWNQRVSYYDTHGNFGRSVQLRPHAQAALARPVGVFGDGSFLATPALFSLGGNPPVRVERTPVPLFHYASDGSTVTLLGSFPGPEQVIAPVGPVEQWERRGRPFGSETAFAAGGDRFYVGDNATYEIRVYSIDGRLLQLIRKAAAPLLLGETDIRAFEDSVLGATDSRYRPQMRRLFAELPLPPRAYPAYAPDLRVDGDLDLWVRETSRTGEPAAQWSVFSATGILRGVVRLPRGAHILDIGADYLICLERDELDVEYVRKYRLRRDGAAAEDGSEYPRANPANTQYPRQ